MLGLWGALTSAAPQKEPASPSTISVETSLVILPVTVVDRQGAYVAGLGREHFAIYDEGKPQDIDFFLNEDVPATIGLVIDSSTSMRGRRQEVTTAAMAFAGDSSPLDQIFTMNFNEYVWPGLPPPVAFTHDAEQLRVALAQAPTRGMTALYDAIDLALDHLQLGTRERKVLVVVSDGGDNASRHTLDAVLDHARRTSTVIYAVMPVDPDNRDTQPGVLKTLARETGGTAVTPGDAQEMMRTFKQIALEIRAGYMIGFAPPGGTQHGFRTIRVQVKDDRRQLTARTRRGYNAGRPLRSAQ